MAPCRSLLPRFLLNSRFSRACLFCCSSLSPDGAERRLAQGACVKRNRAEWHSRAHWPRCLRYSQRPLQGNWRGIVLSCAKPNLWHCVLPCGVNYNVGVIVAQEFHCTRDVW